MKRMLCVLLTLLLCAASAQADAVLDTVDYENAAKISTKSQDGLYLYVVLEDGTAGITGYLGDETALVIPSVVDDLPVTAIGAYAFEYAALTSVVIPEGVTVIDCEAFAAASALKEITLPSTLREIGEEAFIGCALEKVTLSEGVETLGERAFAGCWNLKTITLPNTLRRMGYGVFADCDELWGLTLPASLTEIDGNPIPAIPLSQHFFANSLRIAPDNPVLRIENQMLLAGDTVICAARDVRDVTVPEGITTIGRGAFYSAQVERVTLPEGLTNIQKEAFNGCFALRSVSLPESLQSIGDSAFDWCRSLTEITLPEGLRTIGCHAFESTGLTALKLPESLEEVGHGAFLSNEKLQEVTLPKNLRVIPIDMFYGCSELETVVLLSHKKADSYIHIDVEFGEGEGKIPVDSIAKRAEAYKPKEKVTYKMIKEYIEAKYGFKVHTAYIAEVKRDLGLPMYDAPNAVEELKQPRKHPTPEKVEAIKDALRYFAVI